MKVFIHGSFLLCRPKEGGVSRHKDAGICRLRAAKPHPPFSFPRKKTGGVTVQKKGVRLAVSGLNKPFASGMRMPARGDAAFSIAIRFASASTIRCCAAVGGFAALRMRHTPCGCRSAYLAIVSLIPVYRGTHQCGERSNAAISHAVCRRCERHSRLTIVRRGCERQRLAESSWRSHVHRAHTAQRVQSFKNKTRNVGGRGGLPSSFLLGV